MPVNETEPKIGQLVKSFHSDDGSKWTKQIGLVVDKEFNNIFQWFDYGIMFNDGKLTWSGKSALEIIGWPE